MFGTAIPHFRPRLGEMEPQHVAQHDSQHAHPFGQLLGRPGLRRRESLSGWGRSARGFPGDRAEAAGSCPAVGRGGMEQLGVEPEEETGRDEEEDAAQAMERAEAGEAGGSPGAPAPEEPGGLTWCK